jgi:exopolyphosphatase/guanosine-5'-triphosphate,3'-diphosphate pyrophosphatase
MDFGTNSIRLLVVRIEPNQAYTVLHVLKETVRLGEGEFARHHLQPHAIDRAVAAARRFADVANAAGAEETVAVGTAAAREASNRHVLLDRLRNEAGIDLRIISGREEARLIYLGVASGIDLGDRRAFFIDVGGGSTEVAVGRQHEDLYLSSMKLGAIRLSNLYLHNTKGPVPAEVYKQIKAHIRHEASRTLEEIRQYPLDLAIGSSGTIENLADVCINAFRGRPRRPGDTLSLADLKRGVELMRGMRLRDRRRLPGINPSRADIIVGGAAIVETLMEELEIGELTISDRGLRDGLLIDYLARHGHADVVNEMPLRRRSVLQLARTCRFNEEHANKTRELALRLFDSGAEAGLHQLGEWERELLDYASLLHHIGSFLTYTDYHRHSHYLIRNAELLGFDETESMMMSLIVIFHRGSIRKGKNEELAALPASNQRSVIVLSTLLRLAENLDRGQTGRVRDAAFSAGSSSEVYLDIDSTEDCQVELSGLEGQEAIFETVFGKRLEVRLNGETPMASTA